MIVNLQTEHHLESPSLKGGCRCLSESTHVKMPHCWKSHALAHFVMTLGAQTIGNIAVYGLAGKSDTVLEYDCDGCFFPL